MNSEYPDPYADDGEPSDGAPPMDIKYPRLFWFILVIGLIVNAILADFLWRD